MFRRIVIIALLLLTQLGLGGAAAASDFLKGNRFIAIQRRVNRERLVRDPGVRQQVNRPRIVVAPSGRAYRVQARLRP